MATAFIPEDRHNSNHPLAVDYDNSADIEEALDTLRASPEAVAFARIAKIARPWVDKRPVNFSMFDCGALAKDALDDLAFDAARDVGLYRSDLPEIDKLVDMLGGVS